MASSAIVCELVSSRSRYRRERCARYSACTEMNISDEALSAADDQADLGMDLITAYAVNDVRAGLFEGACPTDVALLVEARRELDDHGDLLVAFGRPLQTSDQRGAHAGPVERLLDGEDVRVVGGLRQQSDDGA